jgi:hypothetical protein
MKKPGEGYGTARSVACFFMHQGQWLHLLRCRILKVQSGPPKTDIQRMMN